jgi:hypothetical protein
MNYLFKKLLPVSGRIKRVYLYHWGADPENRWDSALVDQNGKPRKVYSIVKAYNNPSGIPRTPPVVTTPPVVSTPPVVTTPTVPAGPAPTVPAPTVTLP